ncbi:protein LZIC-like [Homarus americanus]|uniref:protein LZIC-like n=1 Tax=Homarus americanus TaxID=6706 RepID=UPI001C466D1C|nr:protein LZIC-like [Homarus americanus]
MASRGASETQKLRQQMEDQLDRLVAQLSDLEECKADLDEEEYEEVRKDTIEQLNEFQSSLSRMTSGDMTLVDSFNAMQLAIQAAISQAFKTPEVIQMFAKKQPDQLREKLSQIERDQKIGKLPVEPYTQQKVEILSALQKLGVSLTAAEQSFLDSHGSSLMKNFDQVTDETGKHINGFSDK